jgi:beta-lactamase class D
MIKIIWLTFFVLIIGCSTGRNFPKKNVCFLVYDMQLETYVTKYNTSYCKKQLPTASTFKIPLSVMAFDAGILKDEKTSFTWDRKSHFLESWNRDQTAESWMKESVVWVSQEMTPKLGAEKIAQYLKSFDYGNQDSSGELTTFWLTPTPLNGSQTPNTLKISGYEQVEFMRKLWTNKLPVSPHAMEMTRKILPRETNPPHRILAGKTGSGFMDPEQTIRVGWYVAHLTVGLKQYIVVTNFIDTAEVPQPRSFGGHEARELTKQLLVEKDLW